MSFLEELAQKGVINESQIGEIKNRAKEKHGGDIDDALMEFGIPEEKILEIKGEYFQIPVKTVNAKSLSFDALKYIPEDSAVHYNFAPITLNEGVLEVGITGPENIQGMDALQFISAKLGIPFKIFLISKSDYKGIMENYKGISGEVEAAVGEFNKEDEAINEKSSTEVANLSKNLKDVKEGDEKKIVEEAPVIKIVAVILRNAIEGNASDIHIENTGEKVKVRYRVDGTLHTTIVLPPSVYSGVVARIKILSKMRLDEKRKPQDGSFSTTIDGHKIDFRVSTMPSYY